MTEQEILTSIQRLISAAKPETSIRSRARIHLPAGFGDTIADVVATGMGSWRFIIIQTIIVALWMVLNAIGLVYRWDPYPFILLNLLFSTQAAYAAPIIMMSQNRQSAKDRQRDDLEAKEVDEMFQINRQQLEILNMLKQILASQSTTTQAQESEGATA